MKKLVRVKSVEYVEGYKLRLAFTNGKVKVVDLAYIFKGNAGHYFKPLRDLERFKEVYCDYGTICWPNEADFCPDLLYTIGKDVYRNNLKNRFLPASAWQQIFGLHSRLAIRQWSLAPGAKICAASLSESRFFRPFRYSSACEET